MRNRVVVAVLLAVLVLGTCGLADEAGPTESEQGFISLFNGKNLEGWDGDPDLWSVEDGAIVGQTTEENKAPTYCFLVWEGGTAEDFILKFRFRIHSGNSGVQFRSRREEDWVVKGVQAEVSPTPGDVGEIYHDGGRGKLALVGEFAIIDEEVNKHVVEKAANVASLKRQKYYRKDGWNQCTVTARGNHIAQYVNGHKTAEVIDNYKDRQDSGVIALQLHAGPPMKVEYKDIRLKRLPENYGDAVRLFNGKDMEGWTCYPDEVRNAWKVSEGRMINETEPMGYIRTNERYEDFVVRMQFRHLTEGNGGIFGRMSSPDKLWPDSVEGDLWTGYIGDMYSVGDVNLEGGGGVDGPRVSAFHPENVREMGLWNECEMVLNDEVGEFYINRLLQNRVTGCPEVPGYIGLQSADARMEFRNIVLIPILEEE